MKQLKYLVITILLILANCEYEQINNQQTKPGDAEADITLFINQVCIKGVLYYRYGGIALAIDSTTLKPIRCNVK